MRVVFFGSPDFAVPSLEALVRAGHDVLLAVSQPQKPFGRKAVPTDPPVARRAEELGIPVFQPKSLKPDEVVASLATSGADVFVVVAYGRILPQRILHLPRLGCVNVHGSLLPRWRGASPVQAALLSGDCETGVSIMRMDAGMDTGPVYATRAVPIGEGEDAGALSARLARLGADLLVRTLPALGAGTLVPVPQPEEGATLCPKIRREDGRVDWKRTAAEIARQSRAYSPWPGLFAFRATTRIKLERVRAVPRDEGASPGQVLEASQRVVVACGEGSLEVGRLQAEGRRGLEAPEFVRGERLAAGDFFA